jgi:hypothetical protein
MPCDYSKYPPNWKSEIVPRILKRAGNKCEVCGLENKSTVYSLKIYMRCPETGRYGYRSIWTPNKQDADRHKHLGELKQAKVILTIAHLDHDEENHQVKDERLSALCQYCHLNYDAKEKYRRACKNDPK